MLELSVIVEELVFVQARDKHAKSIALSKQSHNWRVDPWQKGLRLL